MTYNVEIHIGKNPIGSIQVEAETAEEASTEAFKKVNVKVTKRA